MAAQKKADEEARLAEEEARRAEEEAERKEKEEAEAKEAERQRRKEKEKAKREQLRKEGKLLTPKQKAEKAAAEARMQAMIKSGQIKVEGLEARNQDGGAESSKKSKVIDSRKKKKQQPSGPKSIIEPVIAKGDDAVETAAEAAPEAPVAAQEKEAPAEVAAVESTEDVKDSWDAGSDVQDDWDAESQGEEEQAEKKDTPAPVAAKATAAPATNGGGADKPKAKAADASDEEDSEEGSDSDDDDDDDSSDEDSSSEDEMTAVERQAAAKRALAAQRREEAHKAALAARNKDDLRSPICCILGHVDTGKTKLLDKIRQTNVQEGEAGGITQQIGATYFPVETLKQKIAPIDPEGKQEFKAPGLLVIDTPGHESFTNLRTRGSSLCNIAILVVDIMHGLEPQTLESIRLLRDKKTPFIVALNKVDRLYGWKATPDGGFRASLAKQDRATRNEFEDRAQKTMVAFAEQGLNSCLYYDNKNFAKNVSLVPTSAHTGEGIPDMLQLLVSLTQERMSERLMYLSELECTVLEVKVIEGLGTTIDVVLSNGTMKEGDKIVVCGLNGPIVTQVRALLTPQPMKEMRIKGAYVHHKMVKAALGVKISAPDLEKAIAGSRLLVCGPDDDEEDLKEEVMSDLSNLMDSVEKSGKGVQVQASTLGSLEALLEFLRVSKIPVSGINIGPVYKKDVMRASTILDKAKELACILCFDVAVDKEAERLAEEMGVRLFKADIIYHLFDAFTAYHAEVMEQKKKAAAPTAVWPCRLKILACFARRDPIIIGAELMDNVDLRIGTPLCAIKNKEVVYIGKVTSLEVNHKSMQVVSKKEAGAGVAVKIECAVYETPKMYGRHFDEKDELYSMISRSSIDTLKEHFWPQVSLEQKKLIKQMKPMFNIP
jgi:translation initiation factor 5B